MIDGNYTVSPKGEADRAAFLFNGIVLMRLGTNQGRSLDPLWQICVYASGMQEETIGERERG